MREIRGIFYYIDAACNVYDTLQVVSNRACPQVIAKAAVDCATGKYHIPEFGI